MAILLCSGVGLVKQINNSSNLEFYSVAVKDGDSKSKLFMRFERKVGDLSSGSGGDGKAFITGGTEYMRIFQELLLLSEIL